MSLVTYYYPQKRLPSYSYLRVADRGFFGMLLTKENAWDGTILRGTMTTITIPDKLRWLWATGSPLV